MAQPTGTFSSYDAVGNREDLSDMIYNVAPSETLFVSMIGKGKATGTNHEWQKDSFRASADNANIEGDDATASAPSATSRLGNYTQLFLDHAIVTGTQEAVNKAGRKKELAYQVAKAMVEIKKDVERACIGVNNPKVAGDDTTAREMASFITYLTSNTSAGATGADPTGDGTDGRTDGTQRALTKALLDAVLQSNYSSSSGNANVLMVGAFNKGVISGLTPDNTTRNVETDNGKLMTSVKVYVGDFHELKVVPNRELRSRDALIIDPTKAKLADLQPVHSYDLAKTGNSFKKEIAWETTLEVCDEAAHGIVADLTTA